MSYSGSIPFCPHIRRHGINTRDMVTGLITSTLIYAGAVTRVKLGALSVSTGKIATGAITTAKVATGAITAEKLAAGMSLNIADLTIGAGTKSDGLVTRSVAEVQTTDATVTTIDSFTLLDENTYHCEAWVIGVESDGSQRASYHIIATVYRTGGGAATIQGTITSSHTQESDAGWECTFTVNSNDIRVSVTGDASTIEWGCVLVSINMSN